MDSGKKFSSASYSEQLWLNIKLKYSSYLFRLEQANTMTVFTQSNPHFSQDCLPKKSEAKLN
jgi:hypothetical protein